MVYTIEIDERSLEQTAEALAILNPGASDTGHMRDMAKSNMWDGSTSIGTCGWEACGFFPKHRPGVMVVRFSVAAHAFLAWKAKQLVGCST